MTVMDLWGALRRQNLRPGFIRYNAIFATMTVSQLNGPLGRRNLTQQLCLYIHTDKDCSIARHRPFCASLANLMNDGGYAAVPL
ncbi:hypothetical protein HNR03_003012 [Pseudomonas sp. JAI111]|uniref:hypothetical protein n=1 Tax=Pseudomonas sp. DR48 TaxID=2871095 RepID=UPI001C98ED48|nr:hypothetical protein [Pseudomonas sp. DR48]MCS3838404.1 hypothetical protein [Pseudomonas sp. JAI111]QZP30884.1 hypothetical protein K5K95_22125 [Pseudomonas sp. DR48]